MKRLILITLLSTAALGIGAQQAKAKEQSAIGEGLTYGLGTTLLCAVLTSGNSNCVLPGITVGAAVGANQAYKNKLHRQDYLKRKLTNQLPIHYFSWAGDVEYLGTYQPFQSNSGKPCKQYKFLKTNGTGSIEYRNSCFTPSSGWSKLSQNASKITISQKVANHKDSGRFESKILTTREWGTRRSSRNQLRVRMN